jgi:hypothetical protein
VRGRWEEGERKVGGRWEEDVRKMGGRWEEDGRLGKNVQRDKAIEV